MTQTQQISPVTDVLVRAHDGIRDHGLLQFTQPGTTGRCVLMAIDAATPRDDRGVYDEVVHEAAVRAVARAAGLPHVGTDESWRLQVGLMHWSDSLPPATAALTVRGRLLAAAYAEETAA